MNKLAWIYQSIDLSKIDVKIRETEPISLGEKIWVDCDSDAYRIETDEFEFKPYETTKSIPEWMEEDKLYPVVTIDEKNNLLMLAWANQEAIRITLDTKRGTYFSRSRNTIWIKGEESGNTQSILDVRSSEHSRSLIYQVKQKGPACHTGSRSCFFTPFKT